MKKASNLEGWNSDKYILMKDVENCCCNFYLHVAKLFYAIAYIDGQIRKEEEEALKLALKNEWLKKYQGKTEVVDEILQNFYVLKREKKNAQESFYEFVQYMKHHEKLFNIPMRNTLWEVSCSIADVVNKKNKSELILLVHLGKQLGIMK